MSNDNNSYNRPPRGLTHFIDDDARRAMAILNETTARIAGIAPADRNTPVFGRRQERDGTRETLPPIAPAVDSMYIYPHYYALPATAPGQDAWLLGMYSASPPTTPACRHTRYGQLNLPFGEN